MKFFSVFSLIKLSIIISKTRALKWLTERIYPCWSIVPNNLQLDCYFWFFFFKTFFYKYENVRIPCEPYSKNTNVPQYAKFFCRHQTRFVIKLPFINNVYKITYVWPVVITDDYRWSVLLLLDFSPFVKIIDHKIAE